MEFAGVFAKSARAHGTSPVPPIRFFRSTSDAGEIKIVPDPAGTRGYDDLRYRAMRAPLGEGLRPDVAGAGDLVRMLEALGRDEDAPRIETMRRVIELDRGIDLDL